MVSQRGEKLTRAAVRGQLFPGFLPSFDDLITFGLEVRRFYFPQEIDLSLTQTHTEIGNPRVGEQEDRLHGGAMKRSVRCVAIVPLAMARTLGRAACVVGITSVRRCPPPRHQPASIVRQPALATFVGTSLRPRERVVGTSYTVVSQEGGISGPLSCLLCT